MARQTVETIGLRRTGRAAIDRDPQEQRVEYVCPHCGMHGGKNARRELTEYRFTDGFMQDLQGEGTVCRGCKRSLRVVPVVLIHDEGEKRRFYNVFAAELSGSRN